MESEAPRHFRKLVAIESASSADLPERHLDQVPDWILPNAYREFGIDHDPVTVAIEHGVDSPEVAALCSRGYVRIATTALDRSSSEAVRRMWDALEEVDSRATREFSTHYDREMYHRDEAAWEAVFFEHLRRHV